MTQRCEENLLFPEEIVPWDEIVKLEINLRIPFRHKAKGIKCITGKRAPYQQSPGGPIVWFPFVLDENYLGFIKEHLQELPSLECPVPLDIANEFIEKFIMLKNSPDMVPSFLTNTSLNADQQRRTNMFKLVKEELQQLVSKGDVFLVDASRNKCEYLTHGVYFSKHEAIQYLGKKGLLDRALSAGCSWRDQIRVPEVEGLSLLTEDIRYGLPQELISMSIQEYRKILTLRKSEVIASQLANFSLTVVDGKQFIEKNSGDINTPAPMIEPVSKLLESGPNLVAEADVVSLIQAPSPSAVPNNSVKSNSSKYPIASENNEAKSLQDNRVTENKMASASENDSVVKRFIGMQDVMGRLGVTRATVYNYMNQNSPSFNPNFPQPVKLNAENKWVEAEINAFMEAPNLLKKKRKPK